MEEGAVQQQSYKICVFECMPDLAFAEAFPTVAVGCIP